MPTFAIGLAIMVTNRRSQRFGDLACGTMVVIDEPPWLAGVAEIEDPRAFQLASFLPADLQVSRTMARALRITLNGAGSFPLRGVEKWRGTWLNRCSSSSSCRPTPATTCYSVRCTIVCSLPTAWTTNGTRPRPRRHWARLFGHRHSLHFRRSSR